MLQFITTLTNNIEALSGSAVQVTITGIFPGSVKVSSTVVFLNGDSSSASTYQTALTSGNTASLFGTSFGSVAVDASSVKAVTVSNPSKLSPVNDCSMIFPQLSAFSCNLHAVDKAAPLGQEQWGCLACRA